MGKNSLIAEELQFSQTQKNGKIIFWKNFSFEVSKKEIVSIIGSSGIGKTTLIRVLAGLHKPDDGKLYINNETDIVCQPVSPVFIVFQDYNLTLLPWLNIKANILLGIFKSKLPSTSELSNVLELLFSQYKNDFESFLKKYPEELSGGEKQRVQIARALISNSDYIFFDEPDTGIDYKTKLALRETIKKLSNEKNKGIVLITHDLENAFNISDKIYIIHRDGDDNATLNLCNKECSYDDFKTQVINSI